MFKFACYAVEVNGELLPQFFKTRAAAVQFCQQNTLNEQFIIQLLRYSPLPYTDPKII